MSEQAAGSPATSTAGEPSEPGRAGADAIDQAIRRFQEGRDRQGAFRLLYEVHSHAVERFFARKGLRPDDCLDLTQDTFLGIYKGLDGYEHRQRFSAWMYRVATTTYLKWLRAAGTAKRAAVEVSRDAPEGADAMAAVPGPQLDALIDEEQRLALWSAITELPEQMRDCLTLRLYHQLDYKEIALVKKLSIETVKAHLFNARKKLRERLAGHGLGELEA